MFFSKTKNKFFYISFFISNLLMADGLNTSCNPPKNGYCITSGDKELTYYKIADNLKNFVAPDAGFELKNIEGMGSPHNVLRTRRQKGVKFALIQADVLEYYETSSQGHSKSARNARDLIEPLRVIFPLYPEEIHIFARKDSQINTFKDIKDKKIALGAKNSGSAMTGNLIYRAMFGQPIPDAQFSYYSTEGGLKALAIDEEVDVWILVTGQPAPRLSKIKEEGKNLIKLVSFNKKDIKESIILKNYYSEAVIKKESYQWLHKDIPTVSIKTYLISQVYKNITTRKNIQKFTESLCKNFNVLKENGHKKWREVELEKSKLPRGWMYSDDAITAFKSSSCEQLKSKKSCTEEEKILSLCKE